MIYILLSVEHLTRSINAKETVGQTTDIAVSFFKVEIVKRLRDPSVFPAN